MLKRIIKPLLISLVISLIAVGAYVRYLESTSIFHPSRDVRMAPAEFGLNFEDIYFKTPDGLKLHGWLLKQKGAQSTFLYLHGNAGNIGDRLEKVSLLMQSGVNVFLFDYRGYGLSQGRPSEAGLYADTLAAYDYLKSRSDIDPRRLMAYGASLGGVCAIDLATKRKLSAIVIDSSFPSAADMSKVFYPYLPTFFLSIKMDSISKVSSITIPKLFFHSPEDDVVPYALGKKLFAASGEPKTFVSTSGRHNDGHIVSREVWLKALRDFLQRRELQ